MWKRDLAEDESSQCVPAVIIVAELDRWLSSLAARRICHELYDTLTGVQMRDLLLYGRAIDPARLKRRLAEAFHDRELVALPLGPIRSQRSGGGGAGGASRPAPPVVVAFLGDQDEQRNQVARNKQEDSKSGKERQPEEEPTWVVVELVDDEGKPVSGARYRVILPSGEVREGTLDAQGQARLDGIVEGAYKVSFPDFDAADWDASP
ncbi:MAG TPA: carboxypeptidase-like regulatory domain-containing protein [Myxococcus sp.]|nr:carboxypeptidase-like regulatory domain-containing protein [Myxococcus sp.]